MRSQITHKLPVCKTPSLFIFFKKSIKESQEISSKKLSWFSVGLVMMYISWLSLFSLYTIFANKIILFLLVVFILSYSIYLLTKSLHQSKSLDKIISQLMILYVTDLGSVLGLTIGVYILSLHVTILFIKRNSIISIGILIYLLIILSQLNWGIPNTSHPFSYHMDEWAMIQSVRFAFRYATPNVQGGSHGVVLFYFLSGIYLIPAILLHIVNPFLIKNSLENIASQFRLFDVFRLNTILYGITTCILLTWIVKKYFRISSPFSALYFIATPIFICLSNFFKYDIALLCWLTLTILFSLRYQYSPSQKNFYFLCIVAALTLAIKLSALPVIIMLILSFILFTPEYKQNSKRLFLGILIFFITFLITGIPDILYATHEYKVWLYANLVSAPAHDTSTLTLGYPLWFFIIFIEYPALFGHALFFLFIVSFLYLLCFIFFGNKSQEVMYDKKTGLFLILSLVVFAASLIPLKIGAGGNRALVFLSFIILIITLTYKQIIPFLSNKSQYLFNLFLIVLLFMQVIEIIPWVTIKYFPTPRETASLWIQQHIPENTLISIENVPIFQGVPNIVLKDFYTSQYFPHAKTQYTYQVIDERTNTFGRFVILSDLTAALTYEKSSTKKTIYQKLLKLGYKPVAIFKPKFTYLHLFNSDEVYYFSGLIPGPTIITIFSNSPIHTNNAINMSNNTSYQRIWYILIGIVFLFILIFLRYFFHSQTWNEFDKKWSKWAGSARKRFTVDESIFVVIIGLFIAITIYITVAYSFPFHFAPSKTTAINWLTITHYPKQIDYIFFWTFISFPFSFASLIWIIWIWIKNKK